MNTQFIARGVMEYTEWVHGLQQAQTRYLLRLINSQRRLGVLERSWAHLRTKVVMQLGIWGIGLNTLAAHLAGEVSDG